LEIFDAKPNLSYLTLVHDPKSELLRVNKSMVCNKKLREETKKGAQNLTLLTKLQGKKKPSTKHVPCTANVTDDDLVKSAMTLDDSDTMLLFVAWGRDEDLRFIHHSPFIHHPSLIHSPFIHNPSTIHPSLINHPSIIHSPSIHNPSSIHH
jgi:hypothetical protein